MRTWKSFSISNENTFRRQLLCYAKQFEQFIFFDSCKNQVYGKTTFDYALAAGCETYIECNAGYAFDTLKTFIRENTDWIFGYFGYDLKNEIEKLHSHNYDRIGFSDLVFFIPAVIVFVKDNLVKIGTVNEKAEEKFNDILHSVQDNIFSSGTHTIKLKSKISKQAYLNKIREIKKNIVEGDVYEINLCQEFYAENVQIEPAGIFNALCEYSKAPFSCLLKWNNKSLISASPERFLKKEKRIIFSQPVKGTIRRGETTSEDIQLKNQLKDSEKERAENVMIVDLVRNDITKYAKTGSIQADELFGIYTFEHVHQMVSKISAELKKDADMVDVIKNAFPMGSMTGAPKMMAMHLIEKYEETRRGLFSGSVGYITPQKDFDFNVVIRSILYNATNKNISLQAGGAITFDSHAEREYEECLLKARALMQVLNSK